jgi:hypothetical protein
LLDLKFDTENQFNDHAFLDSVINDSSDEDASSTQDFIWETMQTSKGLREYFTSSAGSQGTEKYVSENVDILNCFPVKN